MTRQEPINFKFIGGLMLALSMGSLIWWGLIWAGLEGYKHTNDWINALLRIGQ